MKKLIKENDYFSYNFGLKFQGSKHYKTTFGGLLSMAVQTLFLLYCAIIASLFLFNDNSTVNLKKITLPVSER